MKNNIYELTFSEYENINGGNIVPVLGSLAALAYLYESGYNYAKSKMKANW